MELIKSNIHMNRQLGNAVIQITLDDDFNISDNKPDVEKIIKEQGNIIINEIKVNEGKVNIKGQLEFNILYVSGESSCVINSMKGKIPFDDSINMDGITSQDMVSVKYELEDLTSNLVNSRKVSIKALLSVICSAEKIYDEETAVDIEHIENENIKYLKRKINVSQMAINKKDIYRLKEEVVLTSSKKNIMEILYNDISIMNTEFRTMEDQLLIKGDLLVFVIYLTEDGEFDYIEKEINMNGTIEMNGSVPDLVEEVDVQLGNKEVTARPDADGEERIIEVEVVLELDIKAYKEEELEILNDMYSIEKEIRPVRKTAEYERLLMKNNSKARVNDRIITPQDMPDILLICNSTASVKIDEMEINNQGINIEGAVVVNVMYISDEDRSPVNMVSVTVPYSHLVEVSGINDNCRFNVTPGTMHVSVIMLGSREMEVKVAISLDTIVFEKITEEIIYGCEEKELEIAMLQDMPGIVGYVVKSGDSLWNIAKKYYSTVDRIKEINNLDREEVKQGDRLIIVKDFSNKANI